MEELGAGFVLATHDLEIRGAGELLGEQQSGQMTEVGLALYLDMLEHAVKALKAGREPVLDQPLAAATEVELRLPAFLPESYVGDVHVRLSLYKRIAAAADDAELDDLTAELHDRFGPLPPPAHNLLRIAKLKLAARAPRRAPARPRAPGRHGAVRGACQDRPGHAGAHGAEGCARVPPRRAAAPARGTATAGRERALRVRGRAAAAPRRTGASPLECAAWIALPAGMPHAWCCAASPWRCPWRHS